MPGGDGEIPIVAPPSGTITAGTARLRGKLAM